MRETTDKLKPVHCLSCVFATSIFQQLCYTEVRGNVTGCRLHHLYGYSCELASTKALSHARLLLQLHTQLNKTRTLCKLHGPLMQGQGHITQLPF